MSHPQLAVGDISRLAVALFYRWYDRVSAILHSRHLAIQRCKLRGIYLVVLELDGKKLCLDLFQIGSRGLIARGVIPIESVIDIHLGSRCHEALVPGICGLSCRIRFKLPHRVAGHYDNQGSNSRIAARLLPVVAVFPLWIVANCFPNDVAP